MRTRHTPRPPLRLPALAAALVTLLGSPAALQAVDQAASPPRWPGLDRGHCPFGGIDRSWVRFLPARHDIAKPCPLFVVLHGGGGTAQGMIDITDHGFEHLAEHQDAVVVYPEAIETNWHDDRESLDTAAVRRHIDDVGFVRFVIKTTGEETAIDPQRIFAVGISSGAMMCYRLAREAPEIAAIAAVAGLVPTDDRTLTWPNPVSALVMQGTEDPLMPIGGGPLGSAANPRGEVLSLADTTRFLLTQDGLDDRPQEAEPPGATDTHDLTSCRRQIYGQAGTSVEVYTVVGGGHTWPDGRQYLPEPLIGRTSHAFDASEAIWDFCMRHPHR